MGNPSSHASHLASQWLKNRVLLIYLNSFLLTYPKHISAPGLLVSVIRYCLDSTDICLTQCTQTDPGFDGYSMLRQRAEAQALLSPSFWCFWWCHQHQPAQIHSSLSHPCSGKLGSSSQNCLQIQGCSPHWPCLFSHPHLHLEVLT